MRVILFNLYPYRIDREKKRKHRAVAELLLGLVAGLFFCYSVSNELSERVAQKEHFLNRVSAMQSDIANQVAQVQQMKDQVVVLGRQVKALQNVQQEALLPSRWVSYLDETVPSSVSLTRLYVANEVLYVNGFTDAVSSLAKWVNQMESGNALFTSVDLVSLSAPNNGGAINKKEEQHHVFEIKAHIRRDGDAL